jgi:hypothetical protein
VAQSPRTLERAILAHEAVAPSRAAVAPVVVDAGVGSFAARWPEQMAARRGGTDPAGLARQLEPLDALVLRLLAKDPAARPASAEEVARELAAFGG